MAAQDGDPFGPTATAAGSDPRGAATDPLAPGSMFDRYRLVRRLGEGGMGLVYEAHDTELDRRVALKVLRQPARGDSEEAEGRRARLVREAQAMARVAHPNVVPVFDAGSVGDDVYVTMELVAGQDLAAWLAAGPRGWRAVVEVFIQAGQGLAAAHRAGLVHRDFKPSNVIVGRDGRARVFDFGLARSSDGPAEPTASAGPAGSLLASPLTVAGAVMGTPMYMPPEQFRGEAADARSDQYSFCASLWEGLRGGPPFAGTDLDELRRSVTAGALAPLPEKVRVPRRLRGAVRRGVAVEPAQRFSDLDAVVRELVRARDFRRHATVVAVIGVALALTGGVAFFAGRGGAATPCPDARPLLAGVWDEATKEQVGQAFAASSWDGKARAAAEVVRVLDGYAGAWVTMRAGACEATRRGEQSAELLDLRMACLDRRLADLGAFTGLLAHADGGLVLKSVAAAYELPPLATCAETEALRQLTPLPADPNARARIESLRRRVAELRALRLAGKYADGLALARPLMTEVAAAGYAPLTAEAALAAAELEDWGGDPREAEALYHRAATNAAEASDDHTLASALAAQVFVIGELQGRYDAALSAAEVAGPSVTRAHDDAASALLVNNAGAAQYRLGHLDEAAADFERALELRRRAFGKEHPLVASTLANLGAVRKDQRRFEEAEQLGRAALELRQRLLGPTHPEVAQSLTNLAVLASANGDQEGALGLERQALEIRRGAYGEDAGDVARSHCNIAGYEAALARHADAARDWDACLVRYRKLRPPAHLDVLTALTGLTEALVRSGRAGDAVGYGEEALALAGQLPPASLANLRFALGIALVESGKDRTRGLALVRQARATYVELDARNWREQTDDWLNAHGESP